MAKHNSIRSASQGPCTSCETWVHALHLACSCGLFRMRRCEACGGDAETEFHAADHEFARLEDRCAALTLRPLADVERDLQSLAAMGVKNITVVNNALSVDVPESRQVEAREILSRLFTPQERTSK